MATAFHPCTPVHPQSLAALQARGSPGLELRTLAEKDGWEDGGLTGHHVSLRLESKRQSGASRGGPGKGEHLQGNGNEKIQIDSVKVSAQTNAGEQVTSRGPSEEVPACVACLSKLGFPSVTQPMKHTLLVG